MGLLDRTILLRPPGADFIVALACVLGRAVVRRAPGRKPIVPAPDQPSLF